MNKYLASRRVKIGVALILFGAGPLVAIMVAAAIGLWPDPNPNPVGPGILAFFTFWPGVLTLASGIQQVRRDREDRQNSD